MSWFRDVPDVWKVLSVVGAILLAGAAGAQQWDSLETQVAENTLARLIQTFDMYSAIRRQRQLTPLEWAKWCDAGRRLHVFVVCPPR